MVPVNLYEVRILMLAAFLLLITALSVFSQSAAPADTENCLLCHRYPNMGRYDSSGQKRVYYVNPEKFALSVHGKLRCKNCHIGLDRIPHSDVKKVNCAPNATSKSLRPIWNFPTPT